MTPLAPFPAPVPAPLLFACTCAACAPYRCPLCLAAALRRELAAAEAALALLRRTAAQEVIDR